MTVLGLVTARSGSRGFPGKNVALLAGRPLVTWAYRALAEVRQCRPGLVPYLSTDAEEIARTWPLEARPERLRPPELAADDTPSLDVVRYELGRCADAGTRFDAVLLLQPTSPLIRAEHLDRALALIESGVESVIGVAPLDHPLHWSYLRNDVGVLAPAVPAHSTARRQELPGAVRPVGFYVASVDVIRRHGDFFVAGASHGLEIPAEDAIDIDTPADLARAEAVLAQRARQVAPVRAGGRLLGPGHPCFVIAEAGVNHNGDLALAHRLVDVAGDAGADAVKFQTFVPELLVAPAAPKAGYQAARTRAGESQLDMLRALVLPRPALKELAAHAEERGVAFLSAPFDEGSADFLLELGITALKVPSGEITNHPFLAHLARNGRPLLVSTGMSTLEEVQAALDVMRQAGDPAVALLHCVSSYPAAPADCNLSALETMRRAFQVPIGWSDHTEGLPVALAAVAMGADLLEKHFTLDRTLPGPDHAASLEPAELVALVQGVRAAEAARGSGLKVPTAAELETAAVVRRSLHARRRLPAGHRLTAEDLIALRPGTGLPPSKWAGIVGWALSVELAEGDMLLEKYLARP